NAVDAAKVITGLVLSLVKVTVCDAVSVLPHASVTVQFFVTLTLQPVTTSAAIVPVAVSPVEQLSVTVAAPKALATSVTVALQLNVPAAAKVITGFVLSLVKVTVCDTVSVLPHASVTVQFFVTLTLQPVTTSAAIVPVAVSPVEQLSVTVAAPKAFATSVAVALQLNAVD